MKRIVIFQQNTPEVEIYDADESELVEYTNRLTQILENANVTVLETSESSAVLRPSKINSIVVYPIDIDPLPKVEQLQEKKNPKKKPKAKPEDEDIITDAD